MSAKIKTERELKEWFLRAEKKASTKDALRVFMSYAVGVYKSRLYKD